tara:strand:+ start:30969 stop:35006 length:4038 start_codon:yes stop_codon:yes gene_type:complete
MNESEDKQQADKPETAFLENIAGAGKVLRRSWFSYLRAHANTAVLILLVLLASYISVGRLLMPLASTQKDWLENELIKSLGLEITVGSLQGSWFRFSPIISLHDVEIIQEQNSDIMHSLKELNIALDVPQSLLKRQLIINRVVIDEMSLLLLENESGDWSLSGFSASENDNTEQLLDILFNVERLQIAEAKLLLRRYDSADIELNNIYLDIQNNPQNHQAQLQFRINDQSSPVQMALRLDGNPLGIYSANAFLDINNLDLLPLIDDAYNQQMSLTAFNGSAQLWLDFDNQSVKQAQATLANLNLSADFLQSGQSIAITSGSADITAIQPIDKDWSFWAQNLQFDFFNRPWESGDFFIELNLQNESPALDVKGESVNLAIFTDMLEALNLTEQTRQVLSDLDPRGNLRNLHLQTDFSGLYPGAFDLAANLEDVAVDAWAQAPSGSGIFGYVEANQNSGFVDVNSEDFTIHLPRIFQESWHYDAINGRVHWAVDNGSVRVYSDTIDARNDAIHGRVKFEINNQQDAEEAWDSNLNLLVGVLDFDASYKSRYLPTLNNIRGTMDYLDKAVISGNISNSGFIFRGKTSNVLDVNQQTVQTFYQVENAGLRFLDEWPMLENLSGFVKVNNNHVDISTQQAEISDIELDAATAQIRPLPDNAGSWLSVSTSATTAGNIGLNFLRESPVNARVGSYLDSWDLQGEVGLEVRLGIALNNTELENDIQVLAIPKGGSLYIPEYDLRFNGLRGPINFSVADGLQATGLSANLFDFPVAARITSNDKGVVITGNGRVSNTALQDWSLQPEFVKNLLQFSEGALAYRADLTIYNQEQADGTLSSLSLSSDLLGLAFDLPQPFDKGIDESASLDLDMNFSAGLEHITVNFRDQLNADLIIEASELYGGEINFGARNQDFSIRRLNSETGLLISGEISDFNLQEWQEVSQAFSAEEGESAAELVRLVDVRIGNLVVFGVDLPAINTVLRRQGPAWALYLDNEQIQGDMLFPDAANEALDVQLSYLRIPADEEEVDVTDPEVETLTGSIEIRSEEEVDVLADINPADLPAMNFHTDEFSLGAGNMGAWDFQLRSNNNGALISNLTMRTAGASITDLSGETGATIDWQFNNGAHRSSFSGLFSAGNLAEVLPSFGYAAVVQSESARFVSELDWSGSPAAFALKKVNGQVDLQMRNGRFIDIESGSARLFGAFNFDALVRRMQLDFSDLYERGLAYDTISGVLDFSQGTVNTQDNFLIRGPSSTINVNGSLDLVNETIAADVLVNLPLGQNVSMVAGILGAWPIAITTYVASIIFRDQLQNFTTVLYRLEGPWDDPQAGFESDNEAVEEAMEEIGVLNADAG